MSVGHVARLLEDSGIPTVIIAVQSFATRMKMMHLPRVLLTPNLLGRPLGSPGDSKTQRNIILTALNMLENTKNGGEILEFKNQ